MRPDMRPDVARRKVATAALLAFRRLPGPVKRVLVRAGTPSYTIGAVCVFEHHGQMLMLWQPHRRGWSLPGGLLDRGERPQDAVAREVREEVGLAIDPGDPIAWGVHPHSQSVDIVFRVQVDHRPRLSLAAEARKARWWSPEELGDADLETRRILDLVKSGREPERPGRLLDPA